ARAGGDPGSGRGGVGRLRRGGDLPAAAPLPCPSAAGRLGGAGCSGAIGPGAPLAVGCRPQPAAALAGAGGPRRPGRRALPDAPLPAENAAAWDQRRAVVAAELPPALGPSFDEALTLARACTAVLEDDDWLYARIQAAVRRALLGLGRRLASSGALDHAEDV